METEGEKRTIEKMCVRLVRVKRMKPFWMHFALELKI